MTNNLYFKTMRYCLCVVVAIGIAILFYNAFSNTFLWYDESGQFFIAKGLCHYSLPHSQYAGLKEVVFYNRFFNFDPGGYSILLHFWTMISNHYLWLRLLSLIFFVVAIGFAYKIGLLLTDNDRQFAVILASVFFVVSPFLSISGLIRAYSMEMLGVLMSLYYLLKIKQSLIIKELLVLAIILFVFMTSRYDFAIYSFGIFLCVSVQLLKQKGIKNSYKHIIVFGSCLLLGIVIIFFLSMHYQNSHAARLTYMPYIGSDFTVLWSWLSIRFYILLIASGYIIWTEKKMDFIISLSIVVNCLFFFLSVTNYYPWDSEKTLSVTILQYIALVQILYQFLLKRFLLLKVCFPIYVLALLFQLYYCMNSELDEQMAFEELITFRKNIGTEENIYICPLLNPDIRYQFEEGQYKAEKGQPYEKNLLFASDISHALTKWVVVGNYIKPDDVDCNYYLLVPSSKDELKNFLPVKSYKYIYTKKKKEI